MGLISELLAAQANVGPARALDGHTFCTTVDYIVKCTTCQHLTHKVEFDQLGSPSQPPNSVTILGFGSFEARARAARTGVNPQTGEKLQIPATTAPAFKPAQVPLSRPSAMRPV